MPKSTFTPGYKLMLRALVDLRRKASVSQVELSRRLGRQQSFVSNFETGIRRIDMIEFYVITRALDGDPVALFSELVAQLPADISI
jgi:hypothetical protein